MTGLDSALTALRQALDSPRRHTAWRGLVRQRLAAVRAALASGDRSSDISELVSRQHSLHRDRLHLLDRLDVLGPTVQHAPDLDVVLSELHRLLLELERHRQRVADLVYDEVCQELGGSD